MSRLITIASLRNVLIVLLFLIALLGLRWIWSGMFYTPPSPQPVNGVVDLRGIDLAESATLLLKGEWHFYPDALIRQQDLPSLDHQPLLIQVPGDWSGTLNPDTGSTYGTGTYHLRILVDPLEQPVAVLLQGIRAASEAELNGSLVASSGVIDRQATAAYEPKSASYLASYYTEGTTVIDLLVRVANFTDPNHGGMVSAIRFGSQAAMDSVRWYSISFQLVTLIILLLHGLYACILYLFNRQERSLLLMALLTLSVGVLIVSGQDNVLLLWLPLEYTWLMKIKHLAFLWQNILILLVLRKLTEAPGRNSWLRTSIATYAALTGLVLAAPPALFYELVRLKIILAFSFLPLGFLIYFLGALMFWKQRDNDTAILLLPVAGILSNLFWRIAVPTTVYYPIDIIAIMIGFSTYWFKKYFRNARENALLNEQLRKADKLKDEFLANTSHELRTPLHGIMNIAHAVASREQAHLTAKSVQDLQLLITVSRRMSHLLNDLLDVARLQEHRIVLKQEPLYIQAIIPGVVSMLQFMAEGKPVRLQISIPDSLPPASADEQRLVQIMYNLLHNALKYTEQGSITVAVKENGGQIIIQVADTGPGMDEELQARIFVPYEQGVYGSRDSQGIGLGLSICKQLVELHGGTLNVQSEPGRGSVFQFNLPIASLAERDLGRDAGRDAEPAPAALAKSPSIAAGHEEAAAGLDAIASRSMHGATKHRADTDYAQKYTEPAAVLLDEGHVHILAVDDDPVNLTVLAGIMASEAYRITTCRSPHEALALLDSGRWDLLIADVMMPQMSGYELTRVVRERYSFSELPILLLTARSQRADIYTGFAAGANDYVTKPVDATELQYRIRALTGMKRSMDEQLRLEAAYLQAQIHPHFLFNTLNLLMILSERDSEKMRDLGQALTSFLQISFDFLNTKQLVELSHEVQLTEAYLYIEKERFQERLSVIWELEPDLSLLLPPLTIQPLVENAVKHGLLSQARGGTVHIRVARQGNGTLVEVMDDGIGMEPDQVDQLLNPSLKGGGGIGIANTHRRLSQLFGQGLSIASRPREGTAVSFWIPDRRGGRRPSQA